MSLFTPVSGTIGGSLIGLSAGTILLGNGDILGCSGIVSSIFLKPIETIGSSKGKWRVLFVSMFLITSRMMTKFGGKVHSLEVDRQIMTQSSTLPVMSTLGFCVAGFFVGFGTRLSDGCTSGHGICGMARLSKRSITAVLTFMSTGIISASKCSQDCRFATFLHTTADIGISNYFPNESSTFCASILTTIFGGISIPILISSLKGLKNKNLSNDDKKGSIASLSAMLFSAGLFISGMTKNYKIYNFLDLKLIKKGSWDPTLIAVMGSGLLVSAFSYHFVKDHNTFKNDKTLTCPILQDTASGKFNVPTNVHIDQKLIVGSAIFGLGWGLAGLCPGPALFLAANGYPQVLYYWWPSNILGSILADHAKKCIP